MLSTSKVEDLVKIIESTIDQFNQKEFILLHKNEILLKSQEIESISEDKNCDIVIFPQFVTISVITTESELLQKQIDISTPVIAIINEMVDSYPERYVLAFQTKDKRYQVLSHMFPLFSQGWFFDSLVLIRRVYLEDISSLHQHDFREYLIRNCQFAVARGLSFYTSKVWADLAALQLVSKQSKANATPDFVRNNISLYIPQMLKKDDALINSVCRFMEIYGDLTPEQAETIYVSKAASDGCQCGYGENLKFSRFDGKKWPKMVPKTVFFSPYMIYVFTPLKFTEPNYEGLVDEIESINDETADGSIEIVFKRSEKWRFISKQPLIFNSILNEIRTKPKHSKELENNDSNQKEEKEKTDVNDYYLTLFPSQISCQVPDDFVKRTNFSSAKTSTFVFEEEEPTTSISNKIEPLQFIKPKRKNPRKKRRHPGTYPIVPPGKFETNQEYDIVKNNMKTVKLVRMIEDNGENEIDEKEKIPIEKEKFFKLSEDESWEKNPIAIVFVLLIIIDIIKILL